jgi:ribose transport system substrate-binding protein
MKIALSLPDRRNEFQVLQVTDAAETAKRFGDDLEILDAHSHPMEQIQGLVKAINSTPRPDAVIIEPVSAEVMEAVAPKAAALGIACIAMNCTPVGFSTLRTRYPQLPLTVVGSDQKEIGRLQGRQLRAVAPNGGNVLYLHGPQIAAAARERFQGLNEVIGRDFALSVLDGHWSEETAEAAVRSWLNLRIWETKTFVAVAAQDDAMARGARTAIDSLSDPLGRWKSVPFLGIDGVEDFGRRLVDTRVLAGTVLMPSNTGAAIGAIHDWLSSGKLPPPNIDMKATPYPTGSVSRT